MTSSSPAGVRVALEGCQEPRVWSAPPAAGNGKAQEAIDLAGIAGLYLDPWQQFVLRHGLGETADGRWSAFEVALIVSRQNGKGSILEALELAALFLWDERLVLHTAHQFKTSSEHFLRVKSLIEGCDELRKRCRKPKASHGEEQIETLSGNRLRFVARSKQSARGFTADRLVIDEAFKLDGAAMAALLPTMSGVPNPQVWYASSAPLVDSEILLDVRERGRAASSARMAYFEWSAPADALGCLDDRVAWAQANPALGWRISEEFIAAERDAMPAEKFACERLGISEDEAGVAVIPMPLWQALIDGKSTALDPVAFAVDATPDRARWSIATAGAREDGATHIEVVENDSGQSWVLPRLLELVERWQPCAVVVDGGSPAASLLPALRDANVPLVEPSTREVAQACGAFYDAVVEGTVRHLGQPSLTDALAGAKRRDLADAWAWSRRSSATDISPLVAVTLASWGWATRRNELKAIDLNVW